MSSFAGQQHLGQVKNVSGTKYMDTALGSTYPTGLDNFNPLNIIRDVKGEIFTLKPWENPLMAIVSGKGNKRSVSNPKYEMIVRRRLTETCVTTTDIAAEEASKALTIADASNFIRVGDVIFAEDMSGTNKGNRENFIVTTVSGTSVTCKGESIATAGSFRNAFTAASTRLTIIGSARAEGATPREAINMDSEFPFNYTQIFTEPVEISMTEQATSHYDKDVLNNKLAEAAVTFARKIERSFWFGTRAISANVYGTSKLTRKTGGIIDCIYDSPTRASSSDTCVYYDVGTEEEDTGVITEDRFDRLFLERSFDEGSPKKTLFASTMLLSAVSYWSKDKLRLSLDAKKYGLSIYEYITPFGTVDIVLNRHFNQVYGNSLGFGVLLDTDNVGMVYLMGNGVNRDIQVIKDINSRGTDAIKHEYLGELGLECVLPETHSILTGVTSYQ